MASNSHISLSSFKAHDFPYNMLLLRERQVLKLEGFKHPSAPPTPS